MLTDIQKHRVQHAAGTFLTSVQQRDLFGVLGISLPVGAEIVVPDYLGKVFLTERIGKVVIDRCFFQLQSPGSRDLIPVYMKIYDAGTANVLLVRSGIEYLLNMLNFERKKVQFFKNVIFQSMMVELENIDSSLYSYVEDFGNSPQDMWHISNDEPSVLAQAPSILSHGYPWNTASMMPQTDAIRYQLEDSTAHRRLSGWIHDLSTQVNWYFENQTVHPLFIELEETFAPKIGELYEPMSFDPLTSVCFKEPVLSTSDVLKNAGVLFRKNETRLETKPAGWKDGSWEMVTQFSSELLHLCAWLHQLPFYELALRYTLPTRMIRFDSVMSPGNLDILYLSLRNNVPSDVSLAEDLNKILRYWDLSQYSAVEIVKTGRDELFLTFIGQTNRRMYIDLALTTLLSQGITRID